MAQAITLKQFDGSAVLPKDDAILYDMIVGQSGVIYGCALTWTGSNQVHISAGYGIIKGRVFSISEHTFSAALPKSSGSSYYGYVRVVLDLDDSDNPCVIATSVHAKTTTFDSLNDKDCNYNNGAYNFILAEYRATSTGITSFTDVKPMVTGTFEALTTFAELAAVKEAGFVADARLVKAINDKFGGLTFKVDSKGRPTISTDGTTFYPILLGEYEASTDHLVIRE